MVSNRSRYAVGGTAAKASSRLALVAAIGLGGLVASAGANAQSETTDQPRGSTLCTKLPVPCDAVIAHRGASFQAPESTTPAYRLARELGADYLELDLQRTKDGELIAFHDNALGRNTDVAKVFPDRADAPVSAFTLAELKQLDAGSWFNETYPERARDSYVGLDILTLDEVIDIAEGGDNRPGLYIETKVPEQFPGIESDLRAALEARGWAGDSTTTSEPAAEGAVDVADGPGRVIMQTFSRQSLAELETSLPDVPRVLLLWLGEGGIDAAPSDPQGDTESVADYYARQTVASPEAYAEWIDFAKSHGAVGIGPSTVQQDHDGTFSSQFSYSDLAEPWMIGMAHDEGLLIHPYTVDEPVDFERYRERGVDGFFTNRPAALLEFYGRGAGDPSTILNDLGY
ncbi:glycerophosphodiester phosphodiesterase [Salinicola aestuarinus]|uniref:glycerophosphodiester phosphodiesterase n=1 Tax=Salinicola aestuarinus TaxID=1949082 RepID=UPI000DA13C01|nr:glycerophosphodiester phosphodiesterase [Salinicola aestuarinus]